MPHLHNAVTIPTSYVAQEQLQKENQMQQQSHSIPENSAATHCYDDNNQLFPHINYAWNLGRKHCDLAGKK